MLAVALIALSGCGGGGSGSTLAPTVVQARPRAHGQPRQARDPHRTHKAHPTAKSKPHRVRKVGPRRLCDESSGVITYGCVDEQTRLVRPPR